MSDVQLDLRRRTLVRDGHAHRLTTREAQLLAYVTARPGVRVTWDELHQAVWRCSPNITTRAAYQTWRRLLPKLEEAPEHPERLFATEEGLCWGTTDPAERARRALRFAEALTPTAPLTPRLLAEAPAMAAALPHAGPAGRVALSLQLVAVALHAGQLSEAAELVHGALPHATPAAARWLRFANAQILARLGHRDEGVRQFAALQAEAEAACEPALAGRAAINLGFACFLAGELASAERHLDDALALLPAGDLATGRALWVRGALRVQQAQLDAAEALTREALRVGGADLRIRRICEDQLARILLLSGRLAEAEAAHRAICAESPALTYVRHGLALAIAAQGRLPEALAELAHAVADARRIEDRTTLHLHLLLQAMLELERSRTGPAELLALEAEVTASQAGARTPLPTAVLAALAARRGDVAAHAALSARARASRTDALQDRICLALLTADAALALGDPGGARAALDEAAALAERHGSSLEAFFPRHDRMTRALG